MCFYSVPFNTIYVVQLLVNILHISVTYLCNKRLKNTSFNCTTCYKAITCCSVAQWCLILCDPMNCSTPDFPVLHHLPRSAQTRVHLVGEAIQPSHPLSLPSPVLSLSQHQGLFQWTSSSNQVAKVLELRSFQWIFRTDFL